MGNSPKNTIRVRLKQHSYAIHIHSGYPAHFLRTHFKGFDRKSPVMIISNNRVSPLYGPLVKKALGRTRECHFIHVPDSERAKSPEVLLGVIDKICRLERMTRPVILSLGGGVIGDLAGFAASIYKRGVPYVHIPTTLLAQVDSSIGGKTAIDLKNAKNMIGTVYQPKSVLICLDFLKTLPRRQFSNGMAEVIKYGLIQDEDLFHYIERSHEKIMAGETEALLEIVSRSARIKARIVERDEADTKDIRAVLNFGHTFAHAIEAAAGYRGYTHGEAVAVGSLCALRLSEIESGLSASIRRRVERLYASVGLKIFLRNISIEHIMDALAHDKKFSKGKNKFVLLRKLGQAYVRSDVPAGLIRGLFQERIEK